MKKRLSRRSLLKLAPAGAFSVTALAASADQVSASLIPPLPSADGTLARPPLSHVDPELEKRTSNPANASSSHVRLFARTNGQVYSVDDQTPAAVWPVSERVFDVAAYGATGDPLIDDASYIQNAINAAVAAGGGIVDFGDTSKTYQIGATLGLGSNLVLRGHATLRLKDGANVTMLSIYQKTNILIEGLTFDGNKANNTSTGLVGILLNNTSATIDIDNVVIRNVTIRDVNGYGIRVGIGSGGSYSRRVRIEGCRIEGTVRHGINANHKAPGIIIRGNIIKNTTNADSTGEANGIRVSNNSPDSVITDNHIEDPADMGIELWTNCGGAVVW